MVVARVVTWRLEVSERVSRNEQYLKIVRHERIYMHAVAHVDKR